MVIGGQIGPRVIRDVDAEGVEDVYCGNVDICELVDIFQVGLIPGYDV